jgi:diguanylate cyclase (GGDEF)-like protein
LASYCDDETLARVRTVGAHGYVLKPFHDRALQVAIEVALERHAIETKAAKKTELLERIVNSMSDAVIAADSNGTVVLVNDAARGSIGQAQFAMTCPPGPLESGIFESDRTTPCTAETLPLSRAIRGEVVRDVEFFVRSTEYPDGRWQRINAAPMRDSDGTACGGVAVCRDVTEIKALESSLRQLSDLDALTGLYNRRGFFETAKKEFARAVDEGGTPCLFFMDLNGLKHVNDTFGHRYGDEALVDAAQIVRGCFRKTDIVGRMGGDEFVVLVPGLNNDDESIVRARLQRAIDRLNTAAERRYRLSISVGTCRYEAEGPKSLSELVAEADAQMYEEKERRSQSRQVGEEELVEAKNRAARETQWKVAGVR